MHSTHVITIASEKGGVGKTTLAVNLAVYLRALNENLPVTLCSFDNHFSVDRMFRIGHRRIQADVSHLFSDDLSGPLTETGEYGVSFIPSAASLATVEPGPVNKLADNLVHSNLTGIVIIDTRPVLDYLTLSALYAADRIILPVKDAPSLENAANIYQFLDHYHMPRKKARILPCLIDLRVRYPKPFCNSYQLLKAYAINRGYRYFDSFISKSPKVESLNTNPEGKIYPVLTHGRGTEVHVQMTRIARQLLSDLRLPRDIGPSLDKSAPNRSFADHVLKLQDS